MVVTHILRDGTVLPDISGHIVKMVDVPSVYVLMEQINKSMNRKRGKNEKEAQQDKG